MIVTSPNGISHTAGRLIILSSHGRERRRFSVNGGVASIRPVRGGFQALAMTLRSGRIVRVRTSGLRALRRFAPSLGGAVVPSSRGFWLQRSRSDGRVEFDLLTVGGLRRIVSRHPVPSSLRTFTTVALDGDGLAAAADAGAATRTPGIVFLRRHGLAFEASWCHVRWPDPADLGLTDEPGGSISALVTSGSRLVAVGQPFSTFAAVFSIRD